MLAALFLFLLVRKEIPHIYSNIHSPPKTNPSDFPIPSRSRYVPCKNRFRPHGPPSAKISERFGSDKGNGKPSDLGVHSTGSTGSTVEKKRQKTPGSMRCQKICKWRNLIGISHLWTDRCYHTWIMYLKNYIFVFLVGDSKHLCKLKCSPFLIIFFQT